MNEIEFRRGSYVLYNGLFCTYYYSLIDENYVIYNKSKNIQKLF